MKILGTGFTGLVGSRVVALLGDKYEFENISSQTGVDIRDKTQVLDALTSSQAKIVIHMAAKTDVDGCELDKKRDNEIISNIDKDEQEKQWLEEKSAWAINVFGTENVIDACIKTNKKIIYISTDFIFDGTKQLPETYSVDEVAHPINWYGQTKYEGEKRVQASSIPWVIARISYPYRASFSKKDFVRALLSRMQEKLPLSVVSDHIMAPTFIDDIAFSLDALITQSVEGIFHVVGSQFISPYDAALSIAKTFNLSTESIKKNTRQEYFKGKAQRPFCLALKNDTIVNLGAKMSTFEEGIKIIKSQLEL